MNNTWRSTCCVAGAVLINLTLGTFYSIGNLVPYMASYMRENGNPSVTTEHGTWITSTFLLGQGTFIILGSYIEQRYCCRVACIFGCLIHCTSTFITIWAINKSIVAVILIYGLGSGMGCGSSYIASIIAAQKWFPARKGVLTGVITGGFGFGGLIFTNLQTMYINPNNVPANEKTGYFTKEVHQNVPSTFMYMGIIFTVVQTIGCVLAFPPPDSGPKSDNPPQLYPASTNSNQSGMVTSIHKDDALPAIKSVIGAFGHRVFYVIGLMMMLVVPGVVFVNSLGKRYGQAYILDDKYLATVVAVSAVANASGRLTWGYLADKFSFSTCFAMKVGLFTVLIASFPFGFVLASRTNYLFWMLGLFFGFSGTFVLFPIFIEQVFGAKYQGMIYGILYLLLALSSIFTSFMIQLTVGAALADQTKTSNEKLYIRLGPCLIIASSYLLSFAIFVFSLPVKRIEIAISRRKEQDLTRTRGGLMNRPDLMVQDRNLVDGAPLDRENSLGSIVKFVEALGDGNRIKTFPRPR